MNKLVLAALASLCLVSSGTPARADDPDPRDAELDKLYQTVEKLEKRIDDLEASKAQGYGPSAGGSGSSEAGSWADRVRLSGSAALDYLGGGGGYSLYDHGAANVYDARLFVDADLARDVEVGNSVAFRDVGFAFEWNIVRIGYLANNIGDVYVDFRRIGDQSWLNFEMGRFQIPFGENYKRFGRGYYTDPFVALSAPPPWFWDEGVKLWGDALEGKVSYAFAMTDGEGGLNNASNGSQQLSLKLAADPTEWLHLSVSGLRTGVLGTNDSPAFAALWLGEMIPRAFGAGSGAQSFQGGQPVAAGPNKLQNVSVLGADAIFKLPNTRLWLSYGDTRINSAHGSFYDRDLLYWLAELVFELRGISPRLGESYLALKGSGLGTYSNQKGYLLDFRYGDVGYNMTSFQTLAIALGVPVGDRVVMKIQYAFQRINLVDGVTDDEIKEAADDASFFGAEVGVHF